MMDLKEKIRDIPDFPEKGIIFRDITTLLRDGEAFKYAVDTIREEIERLDFDVIVGPESRGFIVGTPLSYATGKGFVPIRKPGKLPSATIRYDYKLEYGSDSLEIHADAIHPGDNVIIVDDLMATGGTFQAAISLVEKLGGNVVAIVALIELEALKARDKFKEYKVFTLIKY